MHKAGSRQPKVRVLIPTGLGLNCEVETAEAFRLVGATPDCVPLLDILEGRVERQLLDYQILAFVGGFSFADHLGAGFVFANKIRWKIYDRILGFIENGGLIIGICNGFQMMVRLGMLPGFDKNYASPTVALAPNDRLGYRDAWIRLKTDSASPCLWTRGMGEIELPIRHGEGKFETGGREILERLEEQHQIALRYVDDQGLPTQQWPDNPNGSTGAVAGICDPTGRLFGLMPHPDAYIYPFQHPQWSRRRYSDSGAIDEGAGLSIFRNGVTAAAERILSVDASGTPSNSSQEVGST
jgi:phosphoribosylformylglycinamidine synthase